MPEAPAVPKHQWRQALTGALRQPAAEAQAVPPLRPRPVPLVPRSILSARADSAVSRAVPKARAGAE